MIQTDVGSALRLGLFMNQVIQKYPKVKWSYALSEEQIASKTWLMQSLKDTQKIELGKVLILGGWVGLLGYLLLSTTDFKIDLVRSIDKDSESVLAADDLNIIHTKNKWKFKAGYGDWDSLNYDVTTYEVPKYDKSIQVESLSFDTIINTCCEHMLHFDQWIEKIPKNRLLILQSNSSEQYEGHVNCQKSLEEFVQRCGLSKILYSGSLDLPAYTRWMLIGYK